MSKQTQWLAFDFLSALARAVAETNPDAAYSQLVVRGDGSPPAKTQLAGLQPEDIVAGPVLFDHCARKAAGRE